MHTLRNYEKRPYTYVTHGRIQAPTLTELRNSLSADGWTCDMDRILWQVTGRYLDGTTIELASFATEYEADVLIRSLSSSLPVVIHSTATEIHANVRGRIESLDDADLNEIMSYGEQNLDQFPRAQIVDLAWHLQEITELSHLEWNADIDPLIATEAAARYFVAALRNKSQLNEIELKVIALAALTGDAIEDDIRFDAISKVACEAFEFSSLLKDAVLKGKLSGTQVFTMHYFETRAHEYVHLNNGSDHVAKIDNKDIARAFFKLQEKDRFNCKMLDEAAAEFANSCNQEIRFPLARSA